jgi:uncharacterized protein (DUF486 family)
MTLAWYGHLKFNTDKLLPKWGLLGFIVISWLIAFFEYCFQVPANRIGFKSFGGPFTLMQLKIIQEVITLVVFVLFSLLFFKTETFLNMLRRVVAEPDRFVVKQYNNRLSMTVRKIYSIAEAVAMLRHLAEAATPNS